MSRPGRGRRLGSGLTVLVVVGVAATTLHGSAPSAAPPPPAPGRPGTPSPPQGSTGEQPSAARPRELGTTTWRPRTGQGVGTVEGYVARPSGPVGDAVVLRVSTTAASFHVVAYRLGAYRGGPAHQVWRSHRVRGLVQSPARMGDAGTRTVEARWRPSVRVETAGWRAGFYVFKLVDSDGAEAAAPYVLRSGSTKGTVALVVPTATWQAYNSWGGYSLYKAPPGGRRSWAVSYDRPYRHGAVGDTAFSVVPTVVAAERAGIPLSYLADLDLDHDPGLVGGARALVSVGHDEYWSARRLAAFRDARAHGTNLLFLGANTAYWKVRIEETRHRPRVVGYKSDADLDPIRDSDPADATGLLRDDPRLGPEQRLTGTSYECFPVDAPFRVVSPRWWGFAGTGVRAGTEFPRLVGVEADRVYPGRHTPRPLQVLGHTEYGCGGVLTSTQAVYYTTPSGAGVLNVGTLRWTCAMSRRCGEFRPDRRTSRFTRQVTRTVLRTFAAGPAGRKHPARDNVADFDLPDVNLVPAS
jgi:hypothetical protein